MFANKAPQEFPSLEYGMHDNMDTNAERRVRNFPAKYINQIPKVYLLGNRMT